MRIRSHTLEVLFDWSAFRKVLFQLCSVHNTVHQHAYIHVNLMWHAWCPWKGIWFLRRLDVAAATWCS